MEFSFDRSSESANLRNGNQSSGNARAETPASSTEEAHTTSHEDGIDTSTITNERLRKAIEKNRARQADRNRIHSEAAARPQHAEQSSFFDKQQQQRPSPPPPPLPREEPGPKVPPIRGRAEERVHSSTPKAAEVVTRRSVARPDEAEFAPTKRNAKKVAGQISYATSNRKKSKSLGPKFTNYLVKGCWLFCMVMILRLIFANGGVMDFYSQRSLYNNRLTELERIKRENMQLVHEIERMQTDMAFQKKLVRDNLGFIAADEFLILFPKEKSVQ